MQAQSNQANSLSWSKVQSNARLHMGFFDLHGGLGRQYGSLGLSIDAPKIEVTVKKADVFSLSVPLNMTLTDEQSSMNLALMEKNIKDIINALACSDAVAVHVTEMIPSHAGLGSGTQLALSIATALNNLFSLNLTVAQLAQKTGRGKRSGIGIAAFAEGGFIIDAGRSTANLQETPPILARYAFPKNWCVLLIEDAMQTGIHGEAELLAFKTLPQFSEALAASLCRHVLMQTMPAMLAEDLMTFGASIHALQMHVGDYFSPAQGSRYASPNVSRVLACLLEHDAPCVGQSSWGPTGFSVFESVEIAEQYQALLAQTFLATELSNQGLSWRLCSANNSGALVTSG
jgi:beta-RFAP synthase